MLEEQKCEEDVFYLAVNYLDRVLSMLALRKTQIQLIATVCMFLASKFSDTVALSAERLVMYTDYSTTVDQLLVSYTLHGVWECSPPCPLGVGSGNEAVPLPRKNCNFYIKMVSSGAFWVEISYRLAACFTRNRKYV